MDQLVRHLGIDHHPLIVVVGDDAPTRGRVAERIASALHAELAISHRTGADLPILHDATSEAIGAKSSKRSRRVLVVGTTGIRLADDPVRGMIVENEWLLQPGAASGPRRFDLMVPIEPRTLLDVSLALYRARTSGRWGAIVAEMPSASRAASPAALSIADAVLIVADGGSAGIARAADVVRTLAASTSHMDAWITPGRAAGSPDPHALVLFERSCQDVLRSGFELRFVA